MWIFRVKRPPGSPPAFKARYVARGFSQRQGVDYFQTFSPTLKMTTLRVLLHVATQRDYELHSLDFSTATTLVALGFAPATADPSLFLRTDTSLPPFYVLVYVDDLVFATADTEALTLVNSELHKRHTCTDLGELRSYLGLQITRDRARRTITLTQSHMVHQVLQRFGFQFSSPQPTPLSSSHLLSSPPSDESVEPSGMGLVLGGRGPVVLTGHADASSVDDSATQRSSQGYTFNLEQPRSPPVLYVDNKAMIALCQEHRTKHIALRYFLARELQQRGQLRLAYVATRANTSDVFTKALPPVLCFAWDKKLELEEGSDAAGLVGGGPMSSADVNDTSAKDLDDEDDAAGSDRDDPVAAWPGGAKYNGPDQDNATAAQTDHQRDEAASRSDVKRKGKAAVHSPAKVTSSPRPGARIEWSLKESTILVAARWFTKDELQQMTGKQGSQYWLRLYEHIKLQHPDWSRNATACTNQRKRLKALWK
ncbi:unnamed protein product [Closterium sp. NIES-54]